MLPVMIGALVSMLGQSDPLPYLLFGFPAAAVVSWFWTVQRLKTSIVEVEFLDSFVSVRSAWDHASGRQGTPPSAVIDVRRAAGELSLTVGLDTVRLVGRDFERFEELSARLEDAGHRHMAQVRERLDPSTR
jgi:hypothetical protein